MSKFFNNIFGNKPTITSGNPTSATPTSKMKQRNITNGKLETDALPVDDDDSFNGNLSSSSATTPTASAEMSANAVRELSDPNYNSSAAMMEISSRDTAMAAVNVGVLSTAAEAAATTNTMNVHNAQQQLVMQFSNASNLHFGSVYNFNDNTSAGGGESRKSTCCTDDAGVVGLETKRQTTTTPRKTTSIVAMMQSTEEPNHRILDTISTHLGEGWKLVMRNLGNSEGQIEQAVIDHQMHGGIKEVIYQLLLQWIRNAEDGEATVGRITTLLWEMNYRECVQRMKLVWKSNSLRKSSTR